LAVSEIHQIFIQMGLWCVDGYVHSSLAVKYVVICAEQIVVSGMTLIYIC